MRHDASGPTRRTVLRATAGVLGVAAGATGAASAGVVAPGECGVLTADATQYAVACPTNLPSSLVPEGTDGVVLDVCRDQAGIAWAEVDWDGDGDDDGFTPLWVRHDLLDPC